MGSLETFRATLSIGGMHLVFIDPNIDGSSMVKYPKSMQSGENISINENVTMGIAIISSVISCLNRSESVFDKITPRNSDPEKLILCKFVDSALSITGFTPKRKFRHAYSAADVVSRSHSSRHFTCSLKTFSEYVSNSTK